MIGSASTVSSRSLALLNPSAGISISSNTALLTSIAIPSTNEDISKLKKRCAKLRVWIIVITFLNEEILKNSMIDKKIDEKEALELKKLYKHYLDKRKEILNTINDKVEDVFGDIISKDSISPEQRTKLKKFLK